MYSPVIYIPYICTHMYHRENKICFLLKWFLSQSKKKKNWKNQENTKLYLEANSDSYLLHPWCLPSYIYFVYYSKYFSKVPLLPYLHNFGDFIITCINILFAPDSSKDTV